MSGIREGAVEAMAKVYFYEVGRRSGVTMAFETAYDDEQADFKYMAGLALDGLVAYLLENRDSWVEASYGITGGDEHHETMTLIRRVAASRLMAVLEADGG